ncbi:unnamed protein product, partial [Amoebophrya sp. A25]|eukprot:GSA25T00017962001.1
MHTLNGRDNGYVKTINSDSKWYQKFKLWNRGNDNSRDRVTFNLAFQAPPKAKVSEGEQHDNEEKELGQREDDEGPDVKDEDKLPQAEQGRVDVEKREKREQLAMTRSFMMAYVRLQIA